MTAADWLAAVAQLAPAVIAMARAYQLHDRVSKLEAGRTAQGERVGQLEKAVDYTAGKLDGLTRAGRDERR